MYRIRSRAWSAFIAASIAASLTLSANESRAQDSASAAPIKLSYQSAFSTYRPLGDLTVGSWRDANDNVTRIGGWREYLKEVQRSSPPTPSQSAAPQANPSSTAAPPAKPVTPDPHAGHRR
jgi:hypothetical protein